MKRQIIDVFEKAVKIINSRLQHIYCTSLDQFEGSISCATCIFIQMHGKFQWHIGKTLIFCILQPLKIYLIYIFFGTITIHSHTKLHRVRDMLNILVFICLILPPMESCMSVLVNFHNHLISIFQKSDVKSNIYRTLESVFSIPILK